MSAHDSLKPHRDVKLGSERSFGIVFATVFLLLGVWGWYGSGAPSILIFSAAGVFLVSGLLWPRVLAPLNWLWFRFGLLLHAVTNPLIMALIYYTTVVPIGLLMRALGKDLLHLKRNPLVASYWINREPSAPAPGSMSKQF